VCVGGREGGLLNDIPPLPQTAALPFWGDYANYIFVDTSTGSSVASPATINDPSPLVVCRGFVFLTWRLRGRIKVKRYKQGEGARANF
jgi:hypothetical protein